MINISDLLMIQLLLQSSPQQEMTGFWSGPDTIDILFSSPFLQMLTSSKSLQLSASGSWTETGPCDVIELAKNI